jgi:hypothetical protein
VWVDFLRLQVMYEAWTVDQPSITGGHVAPDRRPAAVGGEHYAAHPNDDILSGDSANNVFVYTGGRRQSVGGAVRVRDTMDFSRFGSAVWVGILARLSRAVLEAWTDRITRASPGATWRPIADLSSVENTL